MKLSKWVLAILLLSSVAAAQVAGFNGDCMKGNAFPLVFGTKATNPMMGSYPTCTVTVFISGTLVLAPIYSTVSLTVLANPFTANTDGSWLFFALVNTGYDIVMTGGTPAFPTTRTYTDVQVGGTGTSTGGSGSGPAGIVPVGGTGNFVANFAGAPTTSGTLGNTMGGGTTGGVGSQSNVTNYPTAANPEWSLSHGQGGACNTACVGDMCCQFAANSAIQLRTIAKFEAKIGASNLASGTRFWVGLTVYNQGSSLGVNSQNPQNSGAMLSNLPNKTTIAFRFSNIGSLDTTWKAVIIQAGASPTSTVIDTGVAADGTLTFPQPPHVFAIVPSSDDSTVTFFIDGAQVAQTCLSCIISLTPAAANDIMFTPFYLGDNNNVAVSVVTTMWYYNVVYRP